MFRFRYALGVVGVIAVAGAVAAVATSGATAASSHHHKANGRHTTGKPAVTAHDFGTTGLKTITDHQLSTVGVQLAAPTTTNVPVSAAQAAQVAQSHFHQSVIEEALASCTQGSVVAQPCWAISLTPPAGQASPIWGGPALAYAAPSSNTSWTFELVLVDAESGSLITGIVSAVPASATN
jgi:hypothetical protein